VWTDDRHDPRLVLPWLASPREAHDTYLFDQAQTMRGEILFVVHTWRDDWGARRFCLCGLSVNDPLLARLPWRPPDPGDPWPGLLRADSP
jgi:hypothetical protein